MEQIFTAQETDGHSLPFLFMPNAAIGIGNIYIEGNLGGGTVIVKALAPNGQWIPVEDGRALTETGMHSIVAAPFIGKLTLDGATSPNINAWYQSAEHGYAAFPAQFLAGVDTSEA